ncbi:MAG: hypothetical protein HYT12_03720 [Candidatus Liptonbacteria bacterium]|nr:hypothetical protein [Candidatus Liptonbacteria bacterium]
MQELGTGVLNWDIDERCSDRYGQVFLLSSPDSEERVKLVQVKGGVRGRLMAIVKETRQSRHIGDLFHGVFPKTPKVGQKITLGEGTLFFRNYNAVGVQPDDGRDTLWLDINGLYKAHEQTVTLYFEELPAN